MAETDQELTPPKRRVESPAESSLGKDLESMPQLLSLSLQQSLLLEVQGPRDGPQVGQVWGFAGHSTTSRNLFLLLSR